MKSEPKFTPGPWGWEEEILRSFCVFPTDEKTAARTGFVCDIDSRSYEEGLANARLISKAPEMYELVRNLAIFPSKYSLAHIINMAQKLLQQIDGTEGE